MRGKIYELYLFRGDSVAFGVTEVSLPDNRQNVRAMAIPIKNIGKGSGHVRLHGQDARCTFSCAMAILAMLAFTGKMPVAHSLVARPYWLPPPGM